MVGMVTPPLMPTDSSRSKVISRCAMAVVMHANAIMTHIFLSFFIKMILFFYFICCHIRCKVYEVERFIDKSAPIVYSLELKIGLQCVAARRQVVVRKILPVFGYGLQEIQACIES